MIQYICRDLHSGMIRRFLRHVPRPQRPDIRILTYERLFRRLWVRPSHMIFTDLDRLSQFELEIAALTAEAVIAHAPEARILNHPARFLQRFELLDRLWRIGVNPFRVARLELELPELRFPLFLRREADAGGPETGLLLDAGELAAATAELKARGVPLRGRLAVEYCASPDAEGMFRKYAAFRIGEAILPQHIQFSEDWIVKSNSRHVSAANVELEMSYVQTNPHREELLRLTDLAGAQFGRIDYTLLDGRIVVFEINSNPTFPQGDKNDVRQARRRLARERIAEAFTALDTPLQRQRRLYLDLPRPRTHDLPGSRIRTKLRLLRHRANREKLVAQLGAAFRPGSDGP